MLRISEDVDSALKSFILPLLRLGKHCGRGIYMCSGRWRSLKTGSRLEKSHPPATANAIMNSQQLRLLALDLDVTGSLDSQSQVGDGVMGPYFFLLN